MFHYYHFWSSLFHPTTFMERMDNETEIKGYKRRVCLLFSFVILFFIGQSFWGLGTESYTYLFAQNVIDEYVIIRYVSLILAGLFGCAFFIFHYYIFSYFIYFLTDIPMAIVKRVQLFVIAILFAEKLVLTIVFYFAGFATNLSFLSFAPILATYWYEPLVVFAINQLSVGVILAIVVQYLFFVKHENVENKSTLLAKIIFLHVFFAALVGIYSSLPIFDWIVKGVTS